MSRNATASYAAEETKARGGVEDTADFSAILTPHRSLSPRGFVTLMAAISVICFTAGMVFFLAGAWPVMGFFGLDVLLVYTAFKLNYRAARLYETVVIAGDSLTVTRVQPSGVASSWTFNPYWARLELAPGRGRASELSLSSHGRKLVFGSFLTEAEKQDFATALQDALQTSKQGSAA